MAIVVPGAAVNYPSPMIAVGSYFGREPREGRYTVPAEIDWGTMGGASYVVGFNLQNSGSTKALTQICALHVDNSSCGADVQFVFTDTQETITIPAYSPYALVPVFSKSLQFYVIAGIDSEVVETQDTTRFSMFNFVPPPVVVPTSEEQNTATFNNITMANPAPADTQLVATTINGTLENINVSAQLGFAVTGVAIFQIKDGTGKVIAGAQGASATGPGQNLNALLIDMNNIHVRFSGGLVLHFVSSTLHADSALSVNLAYRTP